MTVEATSIIVATAGRSAFRQYNMGKEFKLDRRSVKIFKLRNRSGYAALYQNNLTEGRSADEAFARMVKAAKRRPKRK